MSKQKVITIGILTVLCFGLYLISCSKNDNEQTYEVWSKTMAGNDPHEIAWPDQSENYWEYTLDVEKYPNVGLRFKGEFPKVANTRFFNFTFYDDNSTKRITSIEDFNITPNTSSINPFKPDNLQNTSGNQNNYFEINIVPSLTSNEITKNLNNVLKFPESTKKLSVLLRIYFNSIEHGIDFGGVKLPDIVFFDTNTGKEIGSAVRAKSQYYDKCIVITQNIPIIKPQKAMVFTLAPDLMYSNGPTGYVTSPNRLRPDSVLVFRFIPPTHSKNISDSRKADVRYWSICVGDTLTTTPITLPDNKIIKSDDGYVNFIIIEKQTPKFNEIVTKANTMKINVIVWDNKKYGEPLMVFYRQMYIRDGFEYSVKNVPSFPPLTSLGLPDNTAVIKPENMAHITLGEYGPCGLKLPYAIILSENFNYNLMRIPKK